MQMCLRRICSFSSFRESFPFLWLHVWKQTFTLSVVLSRKVFLYPDRTVWVTLIQKIRLEYPAFLDVLESSVINLGALLLISVTRYWAFKQSHYFFFLLWDLLTHQTTLLPATQNEVSVIYSMLMTLSMTTSNRFYSTRDVTHNSGLWLQTRKPNIPSEYFFKCRLIHIYMRINNASFRVTNLKGNSKM